jgi:flagella basal body P-ring formation protein FlgA
MKIPCQLPDVPVDAFIFPGCWRRFCQITLSVLVLLALPSALAAEVPVQLQTETIVNRDSALSTARDADEARGKLHLMTLAGEFLRSQLRGTYEKLEIRVVDEVGEITMPVGARIRPRIPGGIISRRTVVWLEIEVDGRSHRAVPVWFSVTAWKQVPVAQTDIAAGSELRSGDFALELRDVTQTPGILDRLPTVGGSRTVACSSAAERIRLRTAIESGAPLTTASLELPASTICNPPIVRNAATNKVTIGAAQAAQRGGRTGEIVKEGNPRDGEISLAKIIGPGLVSVNDE